MEIVVNAVNAGGVFQPEVLAKIEDLQDYLNEIPEVTKSISVVDYVRNLNKLLNKDKPDNQMITRDKAIDYVKLASLHGDNIVKSLYTEDNNEGRVTVRMKNVGSSRYKEIVENIEGFIKVNFPLSIGCTITGIVPLLMDMQGYLIESQIKTFTLAFILILHMYRLIIEISKDWHDEYDTKPYSHCYYTGCYGISGHKPGRCNYYDSECSNRHIS